MILDTIESLDRLDYERGNGLITVVAQHAVTGEILMLAHANQEAMQHTLEEGVLWLFSRSRNELWRKGDTSGNVMPCSRAKRSCVAASSTETPTTSVSPELRAA